MSHVAIAWLLGRPGVVSVLLGARTTDQLIDTLESTDLELTDADRNHLTATSAPGIPPYPYRMIETSCDVELWQDLGTHPR